MCVGLPRPQVVRHPDVFTNLETPQILWSKSFHRVHLQRLLTPWKSVPRDAISNPLITWAFFFFFNWDTADFQCWVDLCSTAKWLSYTYIHTYIYIYIYNTHINVYIHPFLYPFSILSYHKILNRFPLARCSRTSQFIHSIYNGFHLWNQISHSTPPQPLPLGNHRSVLYVCKSVSVSRLEFCNM